MSERAQASTVAAVAKRVAPHPHVLMGVLVALLLSFGYILSRAHESATVVLACSLVIVLVSLYPAFLWATGALPGMPIVPLHLFTVLWTYGLPLCSNHTEIVGYEPLQYIEMTVTLVLYCLAVTGAWILVGRRLPMPGRRFLVLEGRTGFPFLAMVLFFACVFMASVIGDGLFALSEGTFAILRSVILALTSVALYVLSFNLGRGGFHPRQAVVLFTLAGAYLVLQMATLFLIGAAVSAASMLVGYVFGARRIPWVVLSVLIAVFTVLHLGKAQMRNEVWGESHHALGITDLPEFFGTWFDQGMQQLRADRAGPGTTSLFERASLAHVLLYAQASTPDVVPHLLGYSYEVIPELLVPRIFWPDKASSHEGTTRLNVEYGIQTAEDAEYTTVGWGLINEAWANFGDYGVVVLGLLLGALYGWAGHLAVGAPALSLNVFVASTFAGVALQTEFTMGVFVTVLFQSLVSVAAIIPLLRRRQGEAS